MNDSAWTPEAMDALPAWTLVRAYHATAHGFGRLFAGYGLTPVQFGVLAQLVATEGLTQAELARHVLIRPQSMGELIKTLVERGLLVRDGPGGRGRRVPVRLTDAGRALLRDATQGVRQFNTPRALGLSDEEAATLNTLLHKMIASGSAETS